MTLRWRLALITSAVVFVLFGISEWLSYRQTAALLAEHEAILMETADHTVALAKLRATRDRMFVSVTAMRIAHAALTLIIAVAVLNYVWYRVIYRPIRRLLAQINVMARGTWKSSLPINRQDEIGELTAAFNGLGQELNSTFRHISTSSRLSAFALIGHGLLREVIVARAEILAATETLRAENPRRGPTRIAITQLKAVHARLTALEAKFNVDFDHEVLEVSSAGPRNG
jgi:HAMP domain-containing protein